MPAPVPVLAPAGAPASPASPPLPAAGASHPTPSDPAALLSHAPTRRATALPYEPHATSSSHWASSAPLSAPVPASAPASASVPAPAARPYIQFGSYVLLHTLGEGQFGKVKLGLRAAQGDEVAIKLIKRVPARASPHPQSESDRQDAKWARVRKETSMLRRLHHPNIVALLEIITSEHWMGIVLEYASGGELFDYILSNQYLREREARRIFAQLVSAVWYMHAKGVVHRDLKLENVLLDRHRNILITDFGFAGLLGSADGGMDLMATSCGSPCYAAPELVLSDKPYHAPLVDVWSTGVILYAMLSGFLPFDDDPNNPESSNIHQLYRYISSTPLSFADHVPAAPRTLLVDMLTPDPAKRITLEGVRAHPWLEPYRELFRFGVPELEHAALAQQVKRQALSRTPVGASSLPAAPASPPRSKPSDRPLIRQESGLVPPTSPPNHEVDESSGTPAAPSLLPRVPASAVPASTTDTDSATALTDHDGTDITAPRPSSPVGPVHVSSAADDQPSERGRIWQTGTPAVPQRTDAPETSSTPLEPDCSTVPTSSRSPSVPPPAPSAPPAPQSTLSTPSPTHSGSVPVSSTPGLSTLPVPRSKSEAMPSEVLAAPASTGTTTSTSPARQVSALTPPLSTASSMHPIPAQPPVPAPGAVAAAPSMATAALALEPSSGACTSGTAPLSSPPATPLSGRFRATSTRAPNRRAATLTPNFGRRQTESTVMTTPSQGPSASAKDGRMRFTEPEKPRQRRATAMPSSSSGYSSSGEKYASGSSRTKPRSNLDKILSLFHRPVERAESLGLLSPEAGSSKAGGKSRASREGSGKSRWGAGSTKSSGRKILRLLGGRKQDHGHSPSAPAPGPVVAQTRPGTVAAAASLSDVLRAHEGELREDALTSLPLPKVVDKVTRALTEMQAETHVPAPYVWACRWRDPYATDDGARAVFSVEVTRVARIPGLWSVDLRLLAGKEDAFTSAQHVFYVRCDLAAPTD